MSLLIATLAFDGEQLEEAKLGILGRGRWRVRRSPGCVFRATALLPRGCGPRRCSAPPSRSSTSPPVDPDRDHIRGPIDAPVTLVEYGDFECPYCGQAEPVVRELLADFGDVRYVWRHLPLTDVHPHAQLAAEAAEAAAAQGAFWEMHDLLLDHQDALQPADLVALRRASSGSTSTASAPTCASTPLPARVAEDVDGADLSGVSGTPTFFVNGRRHYGAYDIATLSAAVRAAGARAKLASETTDSA